MGQSTVREILALRRALGLDNSALGVGESGAVPEERCSPESAFGSAQAETGVDLRTSRVRVGFTRGHLLEVVVQVPLDVAATGEALQIAAEIFLEETAGTTLLDEWVASVAVDRIARTKGLVPLPMPGGAAPTSPLGSAVDLIERGVNAVRASLPESLLAEAAQEGWAALDIPPMEEGIQAEREFASTCYPEALKAALEGLPFSSTRFTQGSEIFLWLVWRAPIGNGSSEERLEKRAAVERSLKEGAGRSTWLAGGSGFGKRWDYMDVWTRPESDVLEQLIRRASDIVGPIEVGFYDSALRTYGFDWEGR